MNIFTLIQNYYTNIILISTVIGSAYKVLKIMESVIENTKVNSKMVKEHTQTITKLCSKVKNLETREVYNKETIHDLTETVKELSNTYVTKELVEAKFETIEALLGQRTQ